MTIRARFDKRYYDRFYGSARQRARYLKDEQRLADFLFAYLAYLGQPVRNVLDLGCGFGQWREIVASRFPSARYLGVEHSEYLCTRFGWEQGSAADFSSSQSFDLVICKDTLQYLSASEFRAAASNLASLCRGALYLSILTDEDWHHNCDRSRTDARVYRRTGQWYRRILARHFSNMGGGLFLSDRSAVIPWELEQL